MIIGVTGTKGKGTTSNLIYKILKGAGRDAYLAGNIGKPAIAVLNRLNKSSVTVLELSSFQLQGLHYSPHIAVILGIFPDHMDSHKSFKEYFESKAQITKFQVKKDIAIYAAGNRYSEEIARRSRGKKIKVEIGHKGSPVIDPNELKIYGPHNLINATMAAAVAKELRISERIVHKTIKAYRGLPFRLQHVGIIKGARVYNDSASTNPMTTIAAINAFKEPTIIIMGGRDKNLDFSPVKRALAGSNVKLVVLYGECREKIGKSIKDGAKIEMIEGDLDEAFKAALSMAEGGDSIVFSPGATSFDMFKDYQDRGDKFNAIVKKSTRRYTSKSKKMQL